MVTAWLRSAESPPTARWRDAVAVAVAVVVAVAELLVLVVLVVRRRLSYGVLNAAAVLLRAGET